MLRVFFIFISIRSKYDIRPNKIGSDQSHQILSVSLRLFLKNRPIWSHICSDLSKSTQRNYSYLKCYGIKVKLDYVGHLTEIRTNTWKNDYDHSKITNGYSNLWSIRARKENCGSSNHNIEVKHCSSEYSNM